MPETDRKLYFIKRTVLIIGVFSVLGNAALAGSSDWRTDYKSMVQAYNETNYDKAADYAKTAIDKVLAVSDQIEKNIALEQIIRQLQCLNARYERQQNYSQQESVLRSILRAEQGKNDDQSSFQVMNAKKNLAVCLVLEGKNKEAEKYLPNPKTSTAPSIAASGWKKDLDLLTQVNKTDDRTNTCVYAKNAVEEALSVKNTTERGVAFSQIQQQLQTAEFKFRNSKDYPGEEQILQLVLKLQQAQEAEKTPDMMFGNFQSGTTLKSLVTCLVMQGKDDEAATYDAQYKEATEKSMKQLKDWQKNFADQLQKLQPTKNKESI